MPSKKVNPTQVNVTNNVETTSAASAQNASTILKKPLHVRITSNAILWLSFFALFVLCLSSYLAISAGMRSLVVETYEVLLSCSCLHVIVLCVHSV